MISSEEPAMHDLEIQIKKCMKDGTIGYGNRESSYCHVKGGPQWCAGDSGDPKICPKLPHPVPQPQQIPCHTCPDYGLADTCDPKCPVLLMMQQAATKSREEILDELENVLKSCAFYDEMISGEGGCVGKRNGETNCNGCSYFEVDGNQLTATIQSLRTTKKEPPGK